MLTRGRRVRDAAAARPGSAGQEAVERVPPPRAVRARAALAARRDERRRPAGVRHLPVDGRRWAAHAIDVLTLGPDGRITDVTAFIDAAAFRALRAAGRAVAMDPGSRPDLSPRNPPRKDRRGTQTSLGRRPHRRRLADGGARHARRGDRAQHHPHRPRRVRRAARMDRQRLQPQLRRAADDGRRARRPLRPAPLLRGRCRALHARVGGLRARARHRLADRRCARCRASARRS